MKQISNYSPNFIEKTKEKLEKRLADLVADDEELKNQGTDDSEIDPVEAASIVAEFYNNQAKKNMSDREVNEIKAALSRIEDGAYGICHVCGSPIEQARLEIVPTATEHMTH